MSSSSLTYINNHRQQLGMLLSGVGIVVCLGFAQSSERVLFPLGQGSAPSALAAMADPGPVVSPVTGQRTSRASGTKPAARIVNPGVPPGLTQPSAVPFVIAAEEPNGITVPGLPSEFGLPGTIGNGGSPFQGGPLAGSGPIGVGAAALPDVVPPVPEPATWLMMILGFGLIGGVLRKTRRDRLVQLQSVAGNADGVQSGQDALAKQ